MVALVDLNQFFPFILLLIRVTSVFFLIPLFGEARVPASIKIMLGISLSFFYANVYKFEPVNFESMRLVEVVFFVGQEIILGLSFGYVVRIAFNAMAVASESISQSSGLSAAAMFNPAFGGQQTFIGHLFYIMTVFIFFSSGCDVVLLSALGDTMRELPFGSIALSLGLIKSLLTTGSMILDMALRLAGPMLFCLFIINLGMGVSGRIIPSLNVISLSFLITVGAALWLTWMFLPYYVHALEGTLSLLGSWLEQLIRGLHGG